MRRLLDADTSINLLRGKDQTLSRLHDIDLATVFLCSIVKAELAYGALRSRDPGKSQSALDAFFSRFTSLPFDDPATEEAGRIRADLAAKGTPIGANDLLIAAIAKVHGLTLVTHNTREFGRVEGLSLDDWELDPQP